MGTCGQRNFCIEFIIFCLKQDIFSWTINSKIFTSPCYLILPSIDFGIDTIDYTKKKATQLVTACLKLGIKSRNSVLNRVGKSAIFVLNRVRVCGAGPRFPTQGYIEYPPRGFGHVRPHQHGIAYHPGSGTHGKTVV